MYNFINKSRIISILAIFLLFSCTKNYEKTFLSKISLHEKLIIEAASVSAASLDYFQSDNDYIFWIDRNQMTLFIYDWNGIFIRRFGEKGHGPGQFNYIERISTLENKYIITDIGKRKFMEFNCNFDFVSEYSFPESYNINQCQLYLYQGSYLTYCNSNEYDDSDFYQVVSLNKVNNTFTDFDKLFEIDKTKKNPVLIDFFGNKIYYDINLYDNLIAIYHTGNVNNFDIEIYNLKGIKIFTIDHPVKKIKLMEISRNLIQNQYKEIQEKYPSIQVGKIPNYYQTVNDLKFDSKGNLWIMRYSEDYNQSIFSVYNKNLEYIGNVYIDYRSNEFVLSKNKLAISISSLHNYREEDFIIVYDINY
jgi:hypothetical protein